MDQASARSAAQRVLRLSDGSSRAACFASPMAIQPSRPRVRDLGDRALTLKARHDELEDIITHGSATHRRAAAKAFVHRLVAVEPGLIQPTYLIRGGLPSTRRQRRPNRTQVDVSRRDRFSYSALQGQIIELSTHRRTTAPAASARWPRDARPESMPGVHLRQIPEMRSYTYRMLSVTERVWRHLIVSATMGRREWSTLSDLAAEVESPVSSVHDALGRPVEIGAVGAWPSGGVIVLDPARLTVLWAGRRRLPRDVRRHVRVAPSASEVERLLASEPVVLGGFGAVVAALGANTIADYETVLVYGDPAGLEEDASGSTNFIVLEPDPLLNRYGRTTPLAQAWVDLFCLPGWQAARFVHETLPQVIGDRVLSA